MFIRTIIVFSVLALSMQSRAESEFEKESTREPAVRMVSYYREPYGIVMKRLLQEGDFEGALDACRKDLRMNENDVELRREYEELRRIIRLRHEEITSRDAIRRSIVTGQLRRYYLRHGIHGENIALAAADYCETPGLDNAVGLVEALTAAKRYREALDFVDSLDPEGSDLRLQIEQARIHIAADSPVEAVRTMQRIPVEKLDSPEQLLQLSRLQAAASQNASAVKTLARCFGLMPTEQLKKVKREIFDYPEFRSIRSAPEFADVMLIRSTEPTCGKPCSRKWIGATIDQRPGYMNLTRLGEIDLNFWRVQ